MTEQNSGVEKTKQGRGSDTLLLVVALLVIAGMGAWFFLGSDEQIIEDVPAVAVQDDLAEEVQAVIATEQPVDDVLERARLAVDAGMLTEPVGSNALYYYSLYLEENPEDTAAAAEVDALLGDLDSRIDAAFENGDISSASSLVQTPIRLIRLWLMRAQGLMFCQRQCRLTCCARTTGRS